MFYQRLQSLCFEKGIKVTNLIPELNLSTGNLSKWKAGGIPRSDTITKLADYFGVSTDYLLGRTEIRWMARSGTDDSGVSAEDRALLHAYHASSADDRAIIDNIVRRYTHESTAQNLA